MTKQDENFKNIEFEPKMNQRQPNVKRDNRKNETLKVKKPNQKGKGIENDKGIQNRSW